MNKSTNKTDMTAKNIIDNAERWSKSDRENHAAAVVLRDNTTASSYIHYSGMPGDIAKAVVDLMCEDAEIAFAIFAAVNVSAHKMFPEDAINGVNQSSKRITELRRAGATDADVRREMLGK